MEKNRNENKQRHVFFLTASQLNRMSANEVLDNAQGGELFIEHLDAAQLNKLSIQSSANSQQQTPPHPPSDKK